MREYILERQKPYHEGQPDTTLAKASSTLERLITEQGFGLASEKTIGKWQALAMRTTWTPELENDLQELHGVETEDELISVLIEELTRELEARGAVHIGFVQFRHGVHPKTKVNTVNICVGALPA